MTTHLRSWWWDHQLAHRIADHHMETSVFMNGAEVTTCRTCRRWARHGQVGRRIKWGVEPSIDTDWADKLWQRWAAEDAWERKQHGNQS